ncbi:MAG: type II toxin-antitoxin system RelE/ParE family toxin [Gammaproteobacteria bacterium]|nr:type II toxin-antitoxin system RelE/ParE family toxin [Gammaproteobacteria bacterium]
MTGQYRVSRAAQKALDEIYLYSLDHFGEAKATDYLTDLFERFEAIAAGKVIGKEIPAAFGVDGKFARCGKHYVF